MNKRDFIKYSALMAVGVGMNTNQSIASDNTVNENEPSQSKIFYVRPENTITRWEKYCNGSDWTPAFDEAVKWAKGNGGASIFIPKGIYNAQITLAEGVYWIGEGRGITIITQPKNANRDIVKSENFDLLSGKGPLRDAPKNFGISNLTIDGNYLDNYHNSFGMNDANYNNKQGFGIKIFGTKFTLDLELVNCAEIGLYLEAVDYSGYTDEQDSKINISGRVFGKEGIVHRGPADICFTHVYLGCAGWLATYQERKSQLVKSNLYHDEPVHVMVADEQKIGTTHYNGHHEFGILHLYGNYNGLAYKSMASGRIKGEHLICENCRGGVYFSEKSWGIINIIDCHNNGRLPNDLASSLDSFPDIEIESKQGLTINAVVRRSKEQVTNQIALKSNGISSKVTLNYFSTQPIPQSSEIVNISSSNSTYDISIKGSNGDAISLSGVSNKLLINATNIKNGAVLNLLPDSKGNVRPNSVDVTVSNCDMIVKSDMIPKVFNLKIVGEIHEDQKISNFSQNRSQAAGFTSDINVRQGISIINSLN